MSLRKYGLAAGRLILLAVALLVAQTVGVRITGVSAIAGHWSAVAPNPVWMLGSLLIYVGAICVVHRLAVRFSSLTGWRLTGALFIAMYGVGTFLPQIDSVVFLNDKLGATILTQLFLMGAVTSALFAPVAVLILGRWKTALPVEPALSEPAAVQAPTVERTAWNWTWRLAVLASSYVVLYYLFGAYIAWQSSAVRSFYGGENPAALSGPLQFLHDHPGVLPSIQLGRGLLFVLCVVALFRRTNSTRRQLALVTGLMFAVWSLVLLMPNPFMPWVVARVHLVEVSTSNLIFGLWTGWLLWPLQRGGGNFGALVPARWRSVFASQPLHSNS